MVRRNPAGRKGPAGNPCLRRRDSGLGIGQRARRNDRDLVARFDLETISTKNDRDMEKLVVVTKEGVEKGAREDLFEKGQCVNRFVAAALILSDAVVSTLKREFRKLADGISIEDAEVTALLRDGVLRRDLLEGEDAEAAMAKVAKHFKQAAKKASPKKSATSMDKNEATPPPAMSMSDQILAEAADAEAKTPSAQ